MNEVGKRLQNSAQILLTDKGLDRYRLAFVGHFLVFVMIVKDIAKVPANFLFILQSRQ